MIRKLHLWYRQWSNTPRFLYRATENGDDWKGCTMSGMDTFEEVFVMNRKELFDFARLFYQDGMRFQAQGTGGLGPFFMAVLEEMTTAEAHEKSKAK